MNIKIVATTHMNYIATKEDFDNLGGKAGGICYMPGTFDDLLNEDMSKTLKRIDRTKSSGHHSVFDHNSITLYLDEIPKIIAMIINNEKQYTTSEKSARYTRMVLNDSEQILYDKWLVIFKNKITEKYATSYPEFFSDSKITKLAQENARYLISVFTPTSMVYTTTYRQYNYLVSFLDRFVNSEHISNFEKVLVPYVLEFVNNLKALPYYDKSLSMNEKQRELSLFSKDSEIEEYFGDVYCTRYKASFAEVAQAQRHRTIDYSFRVIDGEYYIPPIIRNDETLVNMWLKDIKSIGNYPQGTMLEIIERGTIENFVLKMKERKCTFAQLEINQVTNEVLHKYVKALRQKSHPKAEWLNMYTKGSRCTFPDYKCVAPCGFALGVNETRDI